MPTIIIIIIKIERRVTLVSQTCWIKNQISLKIFKMQYQKAHSHHRNSKNSLSWVVFLDKIQAIRKKYVTIDKGNGQSILNP